MSRPDWCPEAVWEKAEGMCEGFSFDDIAKSIFKERIARSLLSAKREGMMEASAICNEKGISEQEGYGLTRATQNYFRARDAIHQKAQEIVK